LAANPSLGEHNLLERGEVSQEGPECCLDFLGGAVDEHGLVRGASGSREKVNCDLGVRGDVGVAPGDEGLGFRV
jgi:hypothetical protein